MTASQLLFPLVFVDVALFCVEGNELRTLVVQRARAPHAGDWALPGGILKPGHDLDLHAAAVRVLREKVSIDAPYLEEVGTASGVRRDSRGWSISVLFYALLPADQVHATAARKTLQVEWATADPPARALAFDHTALLGRAVAALRAKVQDSALPLHLLPARFTLSQLQAACEAVLGRPIDKSAFRRRLRDSVDLVALDEYVRGAQRPAQLFEARKGFSFGPSRPAEK